MSAGADADGPADPAPDLSGEVSRAVLRRRSRWPALAAVPVLLLTLTMLGVVAWTGLSVRPAGEDWCVAWRVRDTGTLGLTHYFYGVANGRLSNALLNAAVYSRGLAGARALPGLLALGFALSTFALLRQLLRIAGRRVPVAVVAAVATGVTVLLLLGSERRYQVLFWAQGSTTHTVPTLVTLWAVLHAIAAWPRGLMAQYLSVVLGTTVAFALSLLSEAPAAVSGVLATAAVLGLLPHARRARDWFTVVWPATWLVGLAGGLVVLQASPGLAKRTATPPTEPSLLSVEGLSATFADWGRVWGTVLSHTPAYLAAIALGLLLGLGSSRATGTGRPRKRHAVVPLLVVAVGSLAVVAGLRLGYGDLGWKFDRTYTSFLYPALLAFCFYGALAGEALGRRRVVRVLVVPVAAALAVTGIGSVVPALGDVQRQVTDRAEAWDEQDVDLRGEASAGVQTARYTPHQIDALSEPFRMPFYPRDWAAHCVERYYRLVKVEPSQSWLESPASEKYRRVHPHAS